jgi:hypothetical protein
VMAVTNGARSAQALLQWDVRAGALTLQLS